ncbi:MAG: hypothetical protein EOR43_23050 [Mesorhizobium sp.]|uniref:hypothetical protein n=1 Tax=Mesorhizobium sp. TaxID=1871066 RepID=UPI000FE376DF|nr:hypothetical protein [Mesorhizobium sp.]RWK19804.1 MAG: hypothetical protein EOR43_23050 [Mesorhizobium sp.]RWK28809.1 MAG: hypothetical protein EOR44_21950 [Mesorhizobium sp.]
MQTYPQSSLEEIIDSERAMLLDGPERYGQHYKHARTATMYLTLCIKSIELDRAEMFGRLFALTKKHHMLSFLSILRLHRAQAMTNLRQVLEAGAASAFAIAHPEMHHFVDVDEFGIMDPSQKLMGKRYKWLSQNYPEKSASIAEAKNRINTYFTHANIISGDSVFRMANDKSALNTPFFDTEDKYYVQVDLWLISNVAIMLMDLFFGVAGHVASAGRSVVDFRDDFGHTVRGLAVESAALQAEIQASERYQKVMQDIARRQQGRGAS